ncbi:TIGR02221 family CRISPR-associated protein [Microcoleus sp. LEGE 07076]|uniref:TIGR02221 family CRISPR-associated protein n=1 Tax=Microcoleus sp. LEGE 07076 TaxID=915322 RepID=UPI00187F96CE|nr:TIGR02221 family CRISPR-associated protein [Microcoleus sp. LEGE 07076]MBE9186341.1 TIGR02221 family CRISPR-associated protein [Microcoleus sp. LEGE 07076]
MKIISFLGLSNYEETTYISPIGSEKVTTPFFQEALVEFYHPETLYVLLTKTVETSIPRGASESNWEALHKRLNGKVSLRPIKNIPERNSPEDVWSIFQQVTNCLQDGDSVIFDITHSFRSVPVVALIAVSYLRVVRQVKIEGLLYGAFEAKNKETNETPTFDLLPIVSLLEWTTATDQFIKTGNGEALASLLHSSNSTTENLAASIKGIAQGLQLLRPMDVMRESALLPDRIKEATPIVSQSVPPFESLLERVEKDYGKFGLVSPEDYTANSKFSLVRQLKMIEWYDKKGQTVQALSLAREWLPSLLCYHFELDPLDKRNRDEMELLLAGGTRKGSNGVPDRKSTYLDQWLEISKQTRTQLTNLWGGQSNLANLRNDVLHAGFRKNPKSAEKILDETDEIIEKLNAIAGEWNLIENNDH